ncbi:hypothetical protein MJI69_31930, partial [Salmonella enterica subsp. enterica serovar Anatum]|nr:hypothetical protein [Salmonella enterica subsp. enterica serovar Anatum]
ITATPTPQESDQRWTVTQQRNPDAACLDCHKPDTEGMHGKHTDAVLLLYRIHRVVKTHHIFHPFTVVKRRLTVAVGTGYRQF